MKEIRVNHDSYLTLDELKDPQTAGTVFATNGKDSLILVKIEAGGGLKYHWISCFSDWNRYDGEWYDTIKEAVLGITTKNGYNEFTWIEGREFLLVVAK